MQLFVIGMHRSGTSAVTRVLNLAGAYFGPEGISNGADDGNPKGHWERRDIRRLCDGVLHESGFDWWRLAGFSPDTIPAEVSDRFVSGLAEIILELDAHRPWVVKEPRLSLVLPLVRPLLEVPICIHVSREPLEVAESLRARNGFPIPVGLALWEHYTVRAFAGSDGLRRLLVRYEDLMADPLGVVRSLVEQLQDMEVAGLRMPTDREIEAFITPDLHRQRREPGERAGWLTQRQIELARFHDRSHLPSGEEVGTVSDGADHVLGWFAEALDREKATETEVAAAAAASEDRVDALEAELARVQADDERRRSEAAGRAASELDAARKVIDGQRVALEQERTQRRDHDRALAADLEGARRQLDLLAGSRTWRVAAGASGVAGRLAAGPPALNLLDKLSHEIAKARARLGGSGGQDGSR